MGRSYESPALVVMLRVLPEAPSDVFAAMRKVRNVRHRMTRTIQQPEFAGSSAGDDLALVQDRDGVGQLIGLFEILRREEDRRSAFGQ